MTGPSTRLLLWGTGSNAQELLGEILAAGHEIVAFVDSNPARQGVFQGRPCLSPEAAAAMTPGADYDLLAIASTFHAEIRAQALALGFAEERVRPACALHFQRYAGQLDQERMAILCSVPWWYHGFEILPGVTTPGRCSCKSWLLAHPLVADLTGKSALDIGAWDGPYTLELARRGAAVTSFDIQPPTHSGYDAMRRVNNLDCRHICANVYGLNPEEHGSYDVVTFFGVYYHLKNPLAALANINAVLKDGGVLLVEGAILEGAPQVDAYWAERAHVVEAVRDVPMGYYVKGDFEGTWSNWWVPNLACLRHWVESSGFEVLECSLVEEGRRALCVARKTSGLPQEHCVLPPARLC